MSRLITELNGCDWQDIVNAASEKCCYEYHRLFLHKAHAAAAEGHPWLNVYELLRDITSLRLDVNLPREALRPQIETQLWRTFAKEDLSREQLEALASIVSDVDDTSMRARIADVCWSLQRSRHDLGRIAIDAYIKSGEAVAATELPAFGSDAIARAVQIASLMGKNGEQYAHVIKELKRLAARTDLHLMIAETVLEQLVEHRAGDAEELQLRAVACAERSAMQGEFWRERSFLSLAERLSERVDDREGTLRMRRRAVDSFLAEADLLGATNDQSSVAAVAHRLSTALQILRTVPGTDEERASLHLRLLKSQSSFHLGQVSATVDVSDVIAATRDEFRCLKSPEDALFRLALVSSPPRIAELRTEVEAGAKEYPLQHLFARVAVDEEGRAIAMHAALLSADGDQREYALRAQMAASANLHHAMTIHGGVLVAMDQINAEHEIRRLHFEHIVRASPFVPPSHREAFTTALHAGYEGRMLECAHILCAQVEAAVRHVLRSSGAVTSKLSADGIQEQLSLNELLAHEAATQIFGEDLVFDMQCVFVERFGANLRNNVAHGLLPDTKFRTVEVMYCWWLVLRLCCLPLIAQSTSAEEQDENRG